jgi:hypothetical protein
MAATSGLMTGGEESFYRRCVLRKGRSFKLRHDSVKFPRTDQHLHHFVGCYTCSLLRSLLSTLHPTDVDGYAIVIGAPSSLLRVGI